jgi:hypothetical protein
VLSSIEQRIKEKIEAVGVPLKDWDIQINYGIKTGCNEAFIIDGHVKDRLIAEDPKSAEIIRPILRGRDIKRYSYDFKDMWLIASHNGYTDDTGRRISPINIEDYPAIKAHLDKYWDVISVRTDKGVTPYNLRNCAYMDDFSKQKIIYPEITKFLAFYLDNECYYANNKCFILTGSHVAFLAAFFNSSLFKYCYRDNFPELLGGSRELRKVFMMQLPVIQINDIQNSQFALILQSAISTDGLVAACEIDNLLFDLYGLSEEERRIIGFIEIQ